MLQQKRNNILSITAIESLTNMYVVEINSHLKESNTTICNVFVDEIDKKIHIYDDLKHKSTTILTEMSRDLAIEFTSLLGLKYSNYRFILYYSPIKKFPFIVELDLKNERYHEVNEKDMYILFYEMAKANKPLIYNKE
ncbi:TPA: hypothetical protein ACF9CH_002853 [Staphylococcus aureus]|nr:hypothetical protein [Staphylococcus aureus]